MQKYTIISIAKMDIYSYPMDKFGIVIFFVDVFCIR